MIGQWTPQRLFTLILAASVGAIAFALFFQYVVGLAPCKLCHVQRWPYLAVIPLAAAGLWWSRHHNQWGSRLLLALTVVFSLAFLFEAAVAGYHVGVEQGWWRGTDACVGAATTGQSLDELRDAIMNAPIVRCNEVQWDVFGISMAGFNIPYALGLAAISLLAVRRCGRACRK
ncbi:MAG: disulfide bond formation protein B [Rhodospirillaceae bacterium]|nr:disulfide bond formation protein B [Rhodospirillaceae bacterium]|tara:strand:+ start:55 stop:573 length:519 start_codon:yes stop_codon:yes gene_type:complete